MAPFFCPKRRPHNIADAYTWTAEKMKNLIVLRPDRHEFGTGLVAFCDNRGFPAPWHAIHNRKASRLAPTDRYRLHRNLR